MAETHKEPTDETRIASSSVGSFEYNQLVTWVKDNEPPDRSDGSSITQCLILRA
jgi:hypothetical protein